MFVDRWSPRAMSGAAVSEAELQVLFEAARWAPSAGNFQPWRILYAHRDSAHWETYFGLLWEPNRLWAHQAGVLLLLVSQTINPTTKAPVSTHSFDTGAAWQSLALQGFHSGFVVHGMAGFDHERAREALKIPAEFQPEAMVAVGRPGAIEALPEKFQAREFPSDRRPLSQTVCEGLFEL
jgi:nitroreductase